MRENEARSAYRAAWHGFLLGGEEKRTQMEIVMKGLQVHCGNWEEFSTSLPGWVEYWRDKK